jgi:hypothetical protein
MAQKRSLPARFRRLRLARSFPIFKPKLTCWSRPQWNHNYTKRNKMSDSTNSNSNAEPLQQRAMTPPQQQPTINVAKLNVDETYEEVHKRNMQEALDRANALPPGGIRSATDPPPMTYRPPPQAQIDPKLQEAFRLGYEQSRVEHYTQGFIGAVTIIAGAYLGYRGVCWAWSCVRSAPTVPIKPN